jgi:calcineurin-like phosphoesterase family protein
MTTALDLDPDFDFDTWRRGRTYYTADLHLGHEKIIAFCDRPFGSVGEMNRVIIERINAVVTGRDTLVILGDVALGRLDETLALLGQLRAKKVWIIPGNHDRFSLAYGHRGAPEVMLSKRRIWRDEYQRHHPHLRCEPDRTPSSWPGRLGGRSVLLSHYPYRGDSRDGLERHRELRPRWTGLPLLHGHVHTRWRTHGPMFNVGVDVNDFAPVSEDVLAEWVSRQPIGHTAIRSGNGSRR